jgi:hypothetical protein
LVLAKALKLSKKFSSLSSELSLAEKASAAKVGIHRGKTSLLHTSVGSAGMTPKMLDLFGSASSSSEDEAAAPMRVPHRKRPRKSPPKIARKSSDVSPGEGMSVRVRSIHLFYVLYI